MINYQQIIETYPWLVTPSQKAIISYDTDGWACGLLTTKYLDWNIVGFYDSSTLLIKEGETATDCIFLDVEIFRENIRSIGHHIVVFDFDKLPEDFATRTNSCLNPNVIRQFDNVNNFTRKYPFATYHLLERIFRHIGLNIEMETEGYEVVCFLDGVYNFYPKYTKNMDEWAQYLGINEEKWWPALNKFAYEDNNATMKKMVKAIGGWDTYSKSKNLKNFSSTQLMQILSVFSNKMGWEINEQKWQTGNLIEYNFNRKFMNLYDNKDYEMFWNANPFSMSNYSKKKISYTLEDPIGLP